MDDGPNKLRVRRWLDILYLTITCIFISVYIRGPIQNLSAYFQSIGHEWNTEFALVVFAVVPIAMFFCLKAIGGFRWKDFDLIYSWSNPPAWYAAVIVVCVFPALRYWLDSGDIKPPLLWFNMLVWVTLFAAGTIIPMVARNLSLLCDSPKDKNPASSSQGTFGQITENPEKLVKWLEKETPIENREDDLFGAFATAKRIVSTLGKVPPQNIFFIGSYGSGKTSTLNLVAEILRDQGVIVLHISAWAYEESRLTGHILKHIIKEISKHTDCISLSLLPLKFQSTFLNLNLGIFNFVKLLMAFDSPEDLIRKIDNILKLSGHNMVIFLEDIDRNPNPNIQQEVYSLFHYFSNKNRISFVITHGGVV